jgi:diphthamide synthase (EF-2-diphthine--ammonia ligase)
LERQGHLYGRGIPTINLFPLWQRYTAQLARSFVDQQFQAIVTCVDTRVLDRSFAGRPYNRRLESREEHPNRPPPFLRDLSPGVDPCGENGEFHTSIFAGPNFHRQVRLRPGEIVLRDSWYFCDLLPE